MKLQTLVGGNGWVRPKKSPMPDLTEMPHELRMTGRGSYYSYSFDLGPGLDIFAIADRLLTKKLATVAASPATTKLRVGKRVIEAEKAHQHAETFEQFLTEMYSETPRLKEMIRISKGLSLSIGYVALKEAMKSYFRPSKDLEISRDDRLDDTRKMVKKSEEKLHDILMSYHIDGALRVRIEQKEHYPRYFKSEPYVRLEMERVLFTDAIAGKTASQVSLMLHRSGICILTFSTDAGEDMDFAQMLSVLGGSSRKLEYMKISRSVMSAYANSHGIRSLVKRKPIDPNGDSNWVTITQEDAAAVDETLSITEAFLTYLRAIENISGRENQSEWQCYTTLSLGAPTCRCKGPKCKEVHRSDFARLVMRAKAATALTDKAEEELLENHLKLSHTEIWIAPGSTIYVAWSADSPDLTEDLRQIVPLESAILQVRQLEQIDLITSAAVVRDKNLFRAQNILAVGLQEYQRNLLVGPDAPAVIDALTTKQGAENLYDRLMDRVKVLESMVSTRYSRTQSRRSIAISISGFLAVLLFLLPRITDSIETFSRQGDWPVKAVTKIDELFGGRGSVVLWIYLLAISAFIAAFVAVSLRPRFRPVRARKFGYSTKREIEISLVEAGERDSS